LLEDGRADITRAVTVDPEFHAAAERAKESRTKSCPQKKRDVEGIEIGIAWARGSGVRR